MKTVYTPESIIYCRGQNTKPPQTAGSRKADICTANVSKIYIALQVNKYLRSLTELALHFMLGAWQMVLYNKVCAITAVKH